MNPRRFRLKPLGLAICVAAGAALLYASIPSSSRSKLTLMTLSVAPGSQASTPMGPRVAVVNTDVLLERLGICTMHSKTKADDSEAGAERLVKKKKGEPEDPAWQMRQAKIRDLQNLIAGIARRKKIDVVFDSSGESLNGVPVLPKAGTPLDLTSAVLDSLPPGPSR